MSTNNTAQGKLYQKLIIIGVDEPRPDRKRSLSNASSNVDGGNKILFFPMGTDPKKLIIKSLVRDQTQASGFDARGVCFIIIDDDKEKVYIKKIENAAKKLGADCYSGVDPVNLDDMNDAEIEFWYRNGRYDPGNSRVFDDAVTENMLEEFLNSDTQADDTSTNSDIPLADKPDTDSMFSSILNEDMEGILESAGGHGDDEPARESTPEPKPEQVGEEQEPPATTPIPKQQPREKETTPEDFASVFGLQQRSEEEILQEQEEKRIPTVHRDNQEEEVILDRYGDKIEDNLDEEYDSIDTGYTTSVREREQEKHEQRQIAKRRRAQEQAHKDDHRERVERLGRDYRDDRGQSALDTIAIDTDASLEGEDETDGELPPYIRRLPSQERMKQLQHEQSVKTFGSVKPMYLRKDVGRVILVTSAKGGVGKSTVAYGLSAGLALARAKEDSERGSRKKTKVWLIESDYHSPKLGLLFGTGDKNIGNVAEALSYAAKNNKILSSEDVHKYINENVHIDEYTGMCVLACPNALSLDGVEPQFVQNAIVSAIRYASSRGDAVIVDHGNLSGNNYSVLDSTLAFRVAHHIVVVGDSGTIALTQNLLSYLTSRRAGASTHPLSTGAIHVVMNNSRSRQFDMIQKAVAPHKINAIIPPIGDLQASNSLDGNSFITNVEDFTVKKAVIERCGQVLVQCGYTDYEKYFGSKTTPNRNQKSSPWWKRTISNLTGN